MEDTRNDERRATTTTKEEGRREGRREGREEGRKEGRGGKGKQQSKLEKAKVELNGCRNSYISKKKNGMEWDGFPGKGIGPGIRLLQSVALLMWMYGDGDGWGERGKRGKELVLCDPPLLDLPAPF